MFTTTWTTVRIRTLQGRQLTERLPDLEEFARRTPHLPLSRLPSWLSVLAQGLNHDVYCVEAVEGDRTCGFLPLAFVSSLLFGRYLVSLPYLNTAGVLADDPGVTCRLLDRALTLADQLKVRFLELRNEEPVGHPAFTDRMTTKVHMRLPLPDRIDELWEDLPPKVRNQVRKGQKSDLQVVWGREELLPEFYQVFSRNMRDLGTPVYGAALFASILRQFPDQAELCVVRAGYRAVAGALLLHGWGVSEVPSASCLREFNSTCANMLLYWSLLQRSLERGQSVFDFGRCSADSNMFRFKKQWGAEAVPATWQYYLREGHISAVRPENPRYGRIIRIWQQLPVLVTRLIGPQIVRGIP